MGAEFIEVVAHENRFEGIAFALMAELKQEAFFEVARADADGIKALNDGDDALEEFFRKFGGGADNAVDVQLEITVVVNTADQYFGDTALAGIESGESHLFQ